MGRGIKNARNWIVVMGIEDTCEKHQSQSPVLYPHLAPHWEEGTPTRNMNLHVCYKYSL